MLVLSKSWKSFFKMLKITKRLTELIAPVKLPSKSDIIKLRDCNNSRLNRVGFCLVENTYFCQQRDALVCRLPLFNARKGESIRIVLSELTDAMEDK